MTDTPATTAPECEDPFGSGTNVEAFHVASMLAEMVDERVCHHPAVMLNPEWQYLAQTARDALHELYEAIGDWHCK